MSLTAVLLAMLRSRMAHPTGAEIGAGVVKTPVAVGRWTPALPFGRRPVGEIADGVIGCVVRFGGEIPAGELNPEWTMSISAGQGGASRGLNAPARYPRMRTGRGCRVSTESRALRYAALTSPNLSAAVRLRSAIRVVNADTATPVDFPRYPDSLTLR